MSFTRFGHSAVLIAATLISASFAQGAFAQSAQHAPLGPIFDGPIDYPECNAPGRIVVANPNVFTCAWLLDVSEDFNPEKDIALVIVTGETCAPHPYWSMRPRDTGPYFLAGEFWVNITCYHRGK